MDQMGGAVEPMRELVVRYGDSERASDDLEEWVSGHLMELARGAG